MDEALTCGQTIGAMTDNGAKISQMGKVLTLGLMVEDIKVPIKWTKNMDLVLTNGLMVSNTKASG